MIGDMRTGAQRVIQNLIRHMELEGPYKLELMTGYSASSASRVMKGTEGISLDSLKKLSDGTGVPVSQLAAWWANE